MLLSLSLLFVYSFIRLFIVCLFARVSVCSFVRGFCLLVCLLICAFVCSFVCSFVYLFAFVFVCSFVVVVVVVLLLLLAMVALVVVVVVVVAVSIAIAVAVAVASVAVVAVVLLVLVRVDVVLAANVVVSFVLVDVAAVDVAVAFLFDFTRLDDKILHHLQKMGAPTDCSSDLLFPPPAPPQFNVGGSIVKRIRWCKILALGRLQKYQNLAATLNWGSRGEHAA